MCFVKESAARAVIFDNLSPSCSRAYHTFRTFISCAFHDQNQDLVLSISLDLADWISREIAFHLTISWPKSDS